MSQLRSMRIGNRRVGLGAKGPHYCPEASKSKRDREGFPISRRPELRTGGTRAKGPKNRKGQRTMRCPLSFVRRPGSPALTAPRRHQATGATRMSKRRTAQPRRVSAVIPPFPAVRAPRNDRIVSGITKAASATPPSLQDTAALTGAPSRANRPSCRRVSRPPRSRTVDPRCGDPMGR